MTVNDTDKFLVNRSGSSYHLEAQNLMAELQDDDLMLVNRSGKSYKATGAEIKGSLKPPAEVIKPQIIAPADGAGISLVTTDFIVNYEEEEGVATEVSIPSGAGYQGTGGSYLGVLNYKNAEGVSCLDVCTQIWTTGTDQYGKTTYPNATKNLSGLSNQRTYFTATAPIVLNYEVGSYLIYAGDSNGVTTDQTFGIVPQGDTVATLEEQVSPVNPQVSRWQLTVTEPGDIQFTIATYGTYYFYAQDGNRRYLEFATDKNLSRIEDGGELIQDDDAARGIVGVRDVPNNKMYLAYSLGDWNTDGTHVATIDQEATGVDPSGVPFLGSTFVSSDGSLDPGSADWQVTTLADTGYSSIVSEVEKHPDMTDPQPKWTSGALEGETEYRARTKYYAATGEASPWSDDVTFKTSTGKQTIQATPGVIYSVDKDNFSVSTPYPSTYTNALSINCIERFAGGAKHILQITLEGRLYQSNILVNKSEIDRKSVSICAGYNSGALVLTSEGEVYYIDTENLVTGSITDKSRAAKCINVLGFGNSSQQFAAVYADGHITIFNGADGAIITEGDWGPSNTPVAMGCYSGATYEADHVLVLTDDGKLYKTAVQATLSGSRLCPGLTREGTLASPVELPPSHDPAKKWIEVCNAGTEPGYGITAATEDGKIYASLNGDKISPTNRDYNWQLVPGIDNAVSAMQSRRSGGAGVATRKFLYVGDDKALYKVEGSGFTPTKITGTEGKFYESASTFYNYAGFDSNYAIIGDA